MYCDCWFFNLDLKNAHGFHHFDLWLHVSILITSSVFGEALLGPFVKHSNRLVDKNHCEEGPLKQLSKLTTQWYWQQQNMYGICLYCRFHFWIELTCEINGQILLFFCPLKAGWLLQKLYKQHVSPLLASLSNLTWMQFLGL